MITIHSQGHNELSITVAQRCLVYFYNKTSATILLA